MSYGSMPTTMNAYGEAVIPFGTNRQGRGRYDRYKRYDKPRKDVWLRPLRSNWKQVLNR